MKKAFKNYDVLELLLAAVVIVEILIILSRITSTIQMHRWPCTGLLRSGRTSPL